MKTAMLSLFILLGAMNLRAQDPYLLFEQANQAYKENDFGKAAGLYEDILKTGLESGEVYYNLGNSYYRMHRPGPARLNYERAKKYLDDDEALRQNLELLILTLPDQIADPPRLFIAEWWDGLVYALGVRSWGWLSLLLFTILLGALTAFFYRKNRGRNLRTDFIRLVSILWILALIVWLQRLYLAETEHFAVIMDSSITVHAEPATNATELFVLHEGTRVLMERRSGDWELVRLKDGKTGWLPVKSIEKI
ncbi:MAG TPA: hypothetical protein ENJ10_04455 [Caldithrix abyssi]|uniref:Tetratricopeptide repeat protein n=1 Tax=Caldithrix abyssi TaxID=187145 RepID=A0A7V1PUJ7_CALAY|nr:hypothetical protein [Caldithrix abyssi]